MMPNRQINNERLLTTVEAIAEASSLEMELDPKVFVFGLDVDDHKSIQGSTAGLLDNFGGERIFGTPLSEDSMTGFAIGAAMAGFRPVHVHIRMDFLLLAMNQLINMAAKAHYMYGGQVKVPLTVRAMVGRSWGQGAQHSQAFHSFFMHIPGVKVLAPSNAYDAKGAISAAIRDDNPTIIMEHRLLCSQKSYVPKESYQIEFGKGRVIKEGSDITIVGVSHMVVECLRAAKILAEVGINAEIVDPISLKPLDLGLIENSAEKSGHLLIVDNGWQTCGLAAEIISTMVVKQSNHITGIKYDRLGFAETPCPTTRSLEDLFYPNALSIAAAAGRLLGQDIDKELIGFSSRAIEVDEFKGPF